MGNFKSMFQVKPISLSLIMLVFATLYAIFYAAQSAAHIPGEHPDLNGTWHDASVIDFIQPRQIGASICLAACGEITPPATAATAARRPPDRPKYRAEFMAKVKDLDARQVEEDSILRCLSPGIPRIGVPDKIVHQTKQIIFLYDDINGSFFRIIPIDGPGHRTDVEASALGDSIAHWEGDTLVVETVNFNDETWLTDDGSFHTTDLKVIEKLRRDGDNLHWQATSIDPAILMEPWVSRPRIASLTDVEILEAPPCIERDLASMEDMSNHDNPR